MFDNPIFFLILISLISAISEWIGKRRKAKRLAEEESEAGIPFPSGPVATVTTEDHRQAKPGPQVEWEERLRRLLEGEQTDDTVPTRTRAPEPAQMPRRAPVEVHPEPFADADLEYSPPSHVTPPELPVSTRSTATASSAAVAGLPSSESKKRGVKSKKPARPAAPMAQGAGFRSRRALRQAIVASVVLGPPKGSADKTDLLPL